MVVPAWYHYVIATVDVEDCLEGHNPSCITFAHYVVFAADEENAYREGQRIAKFRQEPGVIRNDYVIRVSH